MADTLSQQVLRRVKKLGFTPPRIVDLKTFGHNPGQGLADYLNQNHHGTMGWMSATQYRRQHPQHLWPDARSAIVVGLNYGPDTDPLVTLQSPQKATISVYARNRDYHDIMKGRLKELAGLVARDTGQEVKVFVDTAPLMEKPLAAKAGLGWQGKHTNLVSRTEGSWLFLGVILTAAILRSDTPEDDHCGSCRACLDICPTHAFPEPYKLDARKCISYLTIEHKGPVERSLRPKLGNRIYGCDDCLAVCPWNKFAQTAQDIKLHARDDLKAPDLAYLGQLSETEFRRFFSGSPIKRIGRDQFIRNVLYAIGNSHDGIQGVLFSVARSHLASENTTVADAANWAMNRLETKSST